MEQQPAYTYSFGLGAEGLKMLILSLLAIILSAGLSLLWVFVRAWRLARRTTIEPVDDQPLLVLGVKLCDCDPVADFRQRLGRAVTLWEQGWRGKIFILGGETSPGCGSEAARGRDYLLAHGIAPEAIVLEDHSRHTLENLRFVRSMLDGQAATIITNRYHLARTAALARGLGLRFRLCAAEAQFVHRGRGLAKLLRESFFLHWYYTGAFWARLVRDRKSLARIS